MARGRRPDNSLEPSRQLLTQRAFRQRRAAHLAELEAKVRNLERENSALKGIAYVEEDEGSKGSKRAKTERSTSGEGSTLVEEMEAEEEEDENELICERCAGYERDRLETLNAVSAVDNCLSQLSESMHNLRRDLTKHTDTSSIPRREPFGSISPIQTHHLNMPIYQAHSTQTSPLSDTTASHHRHHQLFLEVPNAPARYSELSDPTSATSMTSVASSRFKSPTSPVSPFQAMNLSEPSIGSKIARKKSHTRISNSVDEGQSSKSQSLATTPMYHRPTASVSSIATTPGPSMTSPSSLPSTCTPRGGGCCSNDDSPADGNLERERPSMMTRSREGRDPEMNSGTRRLLEHQQHQEQQQQHQQHFLAAQQQSMQMLSQANHHINHAAYLAQQQQRHQQQQYLLQQQQHHQPHHLLQQRQPQPHQQQPSFMEQLHSPSELPSPLPAEHAKPFNHQSTNQASDYPQIHLDETKCCLGVFECDHQGNILCGNN